MITEKKIKKDFTPYQIAKYEDMLACNYSIGDGFNDLCTKFKLLKSLALDDLSEDLIYGIYLYIEDLENSLRALELRVILKD